MMRLATLLLCLFIASPASGAWLFTVDEVEMADNAALTFPDSDWTICGYFKLNQNTGTGFQTLFGWGGQGTASSLNIYIREASQGISPNAMTANARDAEGDASATSRIGGTPGTSTDWQRVCFTREGSATVTLYLDGVSVSSGSSAAHDHIDAAVSAWFGVDGDGAGNVLDDGLLTDWAKWDRLLSAAELLSLNKFSVACISGHKWLVPMIREYQELVNGLAMTNTNTVFGDGPPLIYCH